jgi:prevent-host-death family protein
MGTVITVNIDEAKTNFSHLLERILVGDEIIITEAGTPVAKLSSAQTNRRTLPYGLLKGKLKVKAGFDDPLPIDLFTSTPASTAFTSVSIHDHASSETTER